MWIEVVGWIGMVLLLSAFYLASTQRLRDNSYLYHAINLVGAVGVLINALSKGVLPPAMVEVAWGSIAIVGLVTVFRRRSHDLG